MSLILMHGIDNGIARVQFQVSACYKKVDSDKIGP